MKYGIIFIISLLVVSLEGFGQSFSQDVKAFENSIKYEIEGDYTKAISALKQSYQENSYEYNLRLGWLDYMAGQYTESASYYNKAISLMPFSIEARNGLVFPLLALGNTSQAVDIYKQILEISPNETSTNYKLALIYYQQGKYIEAEKHLKKVINLFPFDYDTLVLLGWNYVQMGKKNEAKVLFQKALLFKPSDTSASEGLKLTN